jgi:glycerophosphoryl diester phosphodiesterase
VRPLAQLLRSPRLLDRVCVASFSQRRVAAVRRAVGPGLCTAMGPVEVAVLRAAALHPWAAGLDRSPAACAQVPVAAGPVPVATRALVETAHRRGHRVHVWTVDDAVTMHRLLDLGVDGLMTDEPDTLRAVLRARGQWAA